MSTHNSAVDHGWAGTLRNLALGASIASLFLASPAPPPISHGPVQKKIEIVTAIPDGNLDQRMTFVRTPHGLDTPTQIKLSSEIIDKDKIEIDQIPGALRDMSNLPVETLASLAHVSRNAYYKWLDGGGVSDEHKVHLIELYDTFCTLHDLCGYSLRDFLEDAGPAGRPIDWLAAGDNDLVIGLALRPIAHTASSLSSISKHAQRISGLPGWVHPATELNWGVSHLTASQREEALDWLSPRPIVNEIESPNDTNEDDEAIVVWGFFLE
jgi:hypothetical protein